EVLPVLPKYRPVPTQAMVEPLRFPSDFVVLEEVRLIRPDARHSGAIDAAGPKPLGIRGVNHGVRRDLVRQVHPWNPAVVRDPIVDVGAGGKLGRGRGEALRFTGMRRIQRAKPEETVQGVVIPEVSQAARQRPLRIDVPGHLAEYRLVTIDALLVR